MTSKTQALTEALAAYNEREKALDDAHTAALNLRDRLDTLGINTDAIEETADNIADLLDAHRAVDAERRATEDRLWEMSIVTD